MLGRSNGDAPSGQPQETKEGGNQRHHHNHHTGTVEGSHGNQNKAVQESTIRKMTRLAEQYGAVNLSQGFPNEPPPRAVRLALALGVLTGQAVDGHQSVDQLMQALRVVCDQNEDGDAKHGKADVVNQYSPPMGRPDVRKAIADHYGQVYGYEVDHQNEITVTLGATEALASALRTVGMPGDRIAMFQPFHEAYPSQCKIFHLESTFITLRRSAQGHDGGKMEVGTGTDTAVESHPKPAATNQVGSVEDGKQSWVFDRDEVEQAVKGAKAIVVNSPHNPTGKVFTHDELQFIVAVCLKHGCHIITDEIYEHMCYTKPAKPHILVSRAFPEIKDQLLVCNSISKSASATGWRLGWCIHPPHLCTEYRAIHDQMAVMAPHPVQQAMLTYLALPLSFFQEHLATRYLDRLNRLTTTLRQVGFDVVDPEGAYYLWADFRSVSALSQMTPTDAAQHLLEHVRVACVPGDNFYGNADIEASCYLRFAACRSDADIDEACHRLLAFSQT